MLRQLQNGLQNIMHLPESVCINHNVFVQKIELNHHRWIYENVDHHVLGEVFSNHESFSAFSREIQWTTNYFILDQAGVIFGIIRIIPELNDIVSMHGMGWPNHAGFSRNYIIAWVAVTQILLEQYPYLHSNCRSDNVTAFRILEQTGYQFCHFGFHEDINQRSLFFKLDRNDFNHSQLAQLVELSTIALCKSLAINFQNSQPKHLSKIKKIKIQYKETDSFHSNYLLTFDKLLLNQTKYYIKMGNKRVEILSLDFNSFQQHHIAIVNELSFSDWLAIRPILIKNLNIESADLLFMYTKDSTLLLNCFADLLIPMGINLIKEKSVWRI